MILTNVGKLNYVTVKTLLNVKGFIRCKIYFLGPHLTLSFGEDVVLSFK